MSWKPKRGWFSPRATPAPISKVEEVRVGPSSVRFQRVKPEKSVLDRGIIDPGLTYESYRKQTKAERKAFSRNSYKTNEFSYDAYDTEIQSYTNPGGYSWTNRWNSWGFNSFTSSNNNAYDSISDFFVKEPENYITPLFDQISAKTNYWANEDIKSIKELARVCYFKMIDDKDYIAEEFKDPEHLNGRMSYEKWLKKKAIFDNVYDTFIPGHTPLEQAIAVHHKLKDIESKERQGKSLRVGQNTGSYKFRRSDYADPFINNQMEKTAFSKKHKLDILNKISLIGDLGTQFKVEKDTGEKETANSDMFKKKPMRSYDQIRMIEMYQRFLPNYNIKFLTKDLLVNVPIQTSEKKQKIIILCDYSGSMRSEEKQTWVNALLIDRFRYVMKGEAEVFFSFFVSSPNDLNFFHVKDANDVDIFWKSFSNYPSGSYTNMARIVEYVSKEIKLGRLHNLDIDLSKELPEILIINDGQDEVGVKNFPYKVNAISLLQFSDELKNLCVATGGKQVRVEIDDSIIAYSKNGEETIA